jgi:hypothetical protein
VAASAHSSRVREELAVLGLLAEREVLPDVDRGELGAIVDTLVQAAASEAGARVNEAFFEPLQLAVTKHADGVSGLFERARRELSGGEHG